MREASMAYHSLHFHPYIEHIRFGSTRKSRLLCCAVLVHVTDPVSVYGVCLSLAGIPACVFDYAAAYSNRHAHTQQPFRYIPAFWHKQVKSYIRAPHTHRRSVRITCGPHTRVISRSLCTHNTHKQPNQHTHTDHTGVREAASSTASTQPNSPVDICFGIVFSSVHTLNATPYGHSILLYKTNHFLRYIFVLRYIIFEFGILDLISIDLNSVCKDYAFELTAIRIIYHFCVRRQQWRGEMSALECGQYRDWPPYKKCMCLIYRGKKMVQTSTTGLCRPKLSVQPY